VRNQLLNGDLTTRVRLSGKVGEADSRIVSQHAEAIVTSSLQAPDCIRIEAFDPRSDNRRRVVEVAREAVTIRRAVGGVTMAIRVEPRAYRGVALRIIGLEDGRFHYEVRLTHRDPDLSVPLGEGWDLAAIDAQWREWVAFLGLPALAGRIESMDVQVNLNGGEIVRRTPYARRRGGALTRRRPRFLKRRALGRDWTAEVVDVDPTIFFFGWKSDC
jgi:hypothetical protein